MTQRPHPVSLFLTLVLALTLAPAIVQAQAAPVQTCLYAISKDLCTGSLSDGTWGIPFCQVGAPNCFNLIGDDASFRSPITSSAGTCGADPTVPCDEAPDFGSTLTARVDVRSQRHTACEARGSWDGSFTISDGAANVVANGSLVATLGVGTHRRACNSTACSQDCETCWDAQIINQVFDWQIGSEGTLRGSVIAGPYAGCRLTASFQGDFTANGDSRGPQVPDPSWKFCGTLEGVLECPCGIVE